jgi:tripartite-type tricarboxylate transporter receptor subunit TctC
MTSMNKVLACAALAGLVAVPVIAQAAAAPAWPTKPVRLIVPFSPGGGTDIIARILGQKLSETFGQQFIVDNRAGGGGTMGAEMTVRAVPDGYTMCMVSASYGANPALYKLPYDPVNGIAPISLLAVGPLIAVANPSVKANDIKELVALARAKPNSINFGSSGVGSLAHFVGALLDQMTGVEMVHVPYKGTGPGLTDLIAGNIQLAYYTSVAVLPHLKTGKLRALGVTTAKRVDALPGVPAIGEFVPGFVAEHWYGFWTTPGVSPQIIGSVNQALGKYLQLPDVREKIVADGFVPAHSTPEEYRKRLATDAARWTEVAKRGNIKVDTY